MPDSNEDRSDPGLDVLAADVLAADAVELELLIRYEQAPESLSAEERGEVERYLAASPAHRDRARVMVRLAASGDPLAALGIEHGAAEAAAGAGSDAGAEVIPIARFSRVAAPFAIAASIALALFGAVFYLRSERSPSPQPQVVQQSPPTAEEPPQRRPPTTGPERATRLAQDSPEASPVPDPTEGSTPGGVDAPRPPRIDLADRPAPPPPTRAESAPAPVPAPPTHTPASPPPGGTPIEETEGEPILLAALLDAGPFAYRAPSGFDELVRVEGMLRSGSGAAGEAGEPLVVATLTPRHRALTFEPSPTLLWFVSRPASVRQELALIDRRTRLPVLTVDLPAPVEAGIQSLDLAEHGVVLEPGVDYRWIVALVNDPDRRARDTVASGEIRRAVPSEALAASLREAPAAELGHRLARAGAWIDALAWISRQIERHPEEARLRHLRADLLEDVGLHEAARRDRRADPGQDPGEGARPS